VLAYLTSNHILQAEKKFVEGKHLHKEHGLYEVFPQKFNLLEKTHNLWQQDIVSLTESQNGRGWKGPLWVI